MGEFSPSLLNSLPPRVYDDGLGMNKTMSQTEEMQDNYTDLPSAEFFAQQIALGNYVLLEESFGEFLPTYAIVPRRYIKLTQIYTFAVYFLLHSAS